MPPATGSRKHLFIPHELFDWLGPTPHVSADDFPIQPAPENFPFPAPTVFTPQEDDPSRFVCVQGRPVMFAAKPLMMAPRTTIFVDRSNVSQSVKALKGSADALIKVTRCVEMWGRMVTFVLGPQQRLLEGYDNLTVEEVNGKTLVPPFQLPDADPNAAQVPALSINAWDKKRRGLLGLPGPALQAQGICSLAEHYDTQMRRPPVLVNSEAAIATEFKLQFLMPADYFMQTRFHRPATKDKNEYPRDAPHRPSQDLLKKGAYPHYGYAIAGDHLSVAEPRPAAVLGGLHRLEPAQRPAVERSLPKGGFPDAILFASGKPLDHPVVVEIKTWWGISSAAFRRIWEGPDTPIRDDGEFEIDVEGSASVLSQVWGQCHFFKGPFGVWTNGEILALFLRTGRNELTFSHPRPWTDPEAQLVVSGLSFAGVLANAPGTEPQDIIDAICPEAARRTPAQEGLRGDEDEDHDDEDDAEDARAEALAYRASDESDENDENGNEGDGTEEDEHDLEADTEDSS